MDLSEKAVFFSFSMLEIRGNKSELFCRKDGFCHFFVIGVPADRFLFPLSVGG
ncbi:hypothetical cytosolic protein [Syntrophus aciditrophicus SB]|uniref:Hypothetical cytosolic protein n=1 Tax=Syntrophus aciditrophicus (strain SB) TaxID=56780 RepID=Q2LY00_SYNAS|nr:hypothetical cytosolic protein [Syntrophus aciditrophicus SB]